MKETNISENRSEKRFFAKTLSCVEFKPNLLQMSYKFKIRDVSSSGICIVVNESSELLQHIKKGDIYNMKYFPEDAEPQKMRTEIRHISKEKNGRFKGHILVGLFVLD